MKKLLTIILLLITVTCSAQWVNKNTTTQGTADGYSWRFNAGSYGFVYWYTKGQVDSLIASSSPKITAGPITSIPVLAYNPGSNITAGQWIEAAYYQTQPPTATITGGTVYELTISNKSHSLSYSYGRQSATATISTATINGSSIFSGQPSQPGSIGGSFSVITPANTNTTYTILVTTTDSKTATSSTTDTFLPNRYWGRSSSSAPTSTIILAVAGGTGAPQLSGSRSGTFVVSASGSNYPFFAYPSSEGAITSILDVNGFNVITAFNQTTVSVTNASGYTQNYFVYTLNTATSSNYQMTTN